MASSYPPEVKAQVIAAVSMGEPVATVARRFNVPRSTVRVWTDNLTSVRPVVATEKREDLGALVYEYLATGLRTLIAQAREAGDPSYVREQKADQLYLLHGTLADKLIAIFGAIERGKPADNDDGRSADAGESDSGSPVSR